MRLVRVSMTVLEFVSYAIVILFTIFGAILVNLQILGRSPQAWIVVSLPLFFLASMTFSRFTKPKVMRSQLIGTVANSTVVMVVLQVWLLLQASNFLFSPYKAEGAQAIFASALLVFGVGFFSRVANFSELGLRLILWAGIVASPLVLFDYFVGEAIFSSRHTSMFLLIPFALLLYESLEKPSLLPASFLVLSGILATDSRTVIAISLGLSVLMIFFSGARRFRATIALAGHLTLATLWTVWSSSFQSRFDPGDYGIVLEFSSIGGANLVVNTNGRMNVWSALAEQASVATWLFGNGAGFSKNFVRANYGWDSPHNEYLRLFMDFGLFPLLMIAFAAIFTAISLLRSGTMSARQKFEGVSSIFVVSLLAVTDLPLVAVGVIIPLAIVIGTRLSSSNTHTRSSNQELLQA